MTLLDNSSLLIVCDEHTLTIRPRARSFFLWAAGFALLGAALLAVGSLGSSPASGLLRWSGFIVLGCSALFPVKGLVVWLQRPTVLDASVRVLRIAGTSYPFEHLGGLRLERASLGSSVILSVIIDIDGRAVPLVRGAPLAWDEPLTRVVQEFTALLQPGQEVRSDQRAPALDLAASASLRRRFFAALFLVLGAAWATVGFLEIPSVAFSTPGASFGFLIWPLGIFLAPLGLPGPSSRIRLGLGVVWFSLYLLLAYTPIS